MVAVRAVATSVPRDKRWAEGRSTPDRLLVCPIGWKVSCKMQLSLRVYACAKRQHSDWKRLSVRNSRSRPTGSVRFGVGMTIAFSTAFAPCPRGQMVDRSRGREWLSWPEDRMVERSEEGVRTLLIDDEPNILRTFRYCLEDAGHRVSTATDAEQAEQIVQRDVFDLCFLDLRLGSSSGLELLPKLRQYSPWMKVIMVTAHSSIDSALEAMRAGASDYLVKPCMPEQLRLAASKQIQARRLEQRVEALEKDNSGIAGAMESSSPAMKKVLETLRQVADTA